MPDNINLDNMDENQVMDYFVDQLLAAKGIAKDYDEEVRKELHRDLKERLVGHINEALIEQLPDDKLEALGQEIDNKSATTEKVREIVQSSGINVEDITAKAMTTFGQIYLGDTADTKEG